MSLRSLKSTRQLVQHLSTGVGAEKLPSSITQISLTLPIKGKHQAMGAKHFLHEQLPRLQYNNPNVTFLVNKSSQPAVKAEVIVHSNDKQKKIPVVGLSSVAIHSMVMQSTL